MRTGASGLKNRLLATPNLELTVRVAKIVTSMNTPHDSGTLQAILVLYSMFAIKLLWLSSLRGVLEKIERG
jgi:hypothetical protein